jgi:hypothetical protein
MADNTTTIDIKINAAEAAKTTKELKKALKELIDQQSNVAAGSKEWKKLTNAINETEGKIGDLQDSFKTLQGSGIDRVKSSFNLLKEGFTSFDGGKIKAAFSGIGAAMKAIPIFLVLEGIRYLIENFDKLKNSGGLLGKVFTFIGDVISAVVEQIEYFLDAIGLVDKELNDLAAAAEENAKRVTEALTEQTAEYDRQIAIAKASGKNAVDLEIAKQQAILNTNKIIAEQTLQLIKQGKVLTDEEVKRAKDAINNIKNATAQIDVIKIQEVEKEKERNKKSLEDYKKLEEEKFKAYLERLDKQRALEKEAEDIGVMLGKLEEEKQAKLKSFEDELARRNMMNLYYDTQRNLAADKLKEEQDKKDLELEREKERTKFELTKQGLMASQQLAEAFFMFRLNSVRKGSAEEERIARKAFQVNKAMQLGVATMQGFQAVQAAFTSASANVALTSVFPAYPFIQAGIAGAFSAASIAKIAASQFQGGGGGSLNAPNVSVPNAPVISTPQNNVSGTQFDNNGNVINQQQNQQQNIMVKAVVVESEMTESQNIITKYKKQSTF